MCLAVRSSDSCLLLFQWVDCSEGRRAWRKLVMAGSGCKPQFSAPVVTPVARVECPAGRRMNVPQGYTP